MLTTIGAANTAIADLNKQIARLNDVNIGNGQVLRNVQALAAPKFQWDAGLKQADSLVQTINKGKISIADFGNIWKNQVRSIAQEQTRLSQATMTTTGNGRTQMYIPAAAEANKFAGASAMANAQLGIQGQLLKGLGTTIQDWGKNTQWAGRQLTVGFTVPFAAAAIAAASYANTIDQDITRIEKVYDGSTQNLKQMAVQTAEAITHSMGQTADSSLKVMYDLASAGKSGQDLMQMTTQAQTLSTLGNIDQEQSVKSLIAVQNIFGLSTKQTADAVNYLNSVEASTPSSLSDLTNAIPIAGAVVKALGGNLQDTVVLLSAFREKGISTQEGANAIKTSMARVIQATAPAQKMFQDLTGVSLSKLVKGDNAAPLQTFQDIAKAIMNTNISLEDQQRLVSTVFGKQQFARMDALLSALNEQNGAVQKAQQIADKGPEAWAETTQKHLQAIQGSVSNKFKVAVQDLKNQFLDFGETALKVVTAIVGGLTNIFKAFNSLPDPVKHAIEVVGVLVAVAGPIAMMVGLFANFIGMGLKLAGTILKLGSGFKSMTIEQKAAQLAAGEVNKNMLSESDTAQVLVYQMGKLTQAYLDNSAAAKQAADESAVAADAQVKASNQVGAAQSQRQKNSIDNMQVLSLNNMTGGEHVAALAAASSLSGGQSQQIKSWANKTQELIQASFTKMQETIQLPDWSTQMAAINERNAINAKNVGPTQSYIPMSSKVQGMISANSEMNGSASSYDSWATKVQNVTKETNAQMLASANISKQTQNISENQAKIATGAESASKFSKLFSQQALLAAGAITMIGSGITSGNQGLSTFLNYTSDILIAFTLMYPLIGKIFTLLKESSMLSGVSSVAKNILAKDAISGALTSVTSVLKTGATELIGAVLSPIGLLVTGIFAAGFTMMKVLNDKERDSVNNINALSNSTQGWLDMLGVAGAKWGQIRDASGKVVESIDSMVKKMRETNPALVDLMASLKGPALDKEVREQAEKLSGQGLGQNDIVNALTIGLTAAGKSADEIRNTLANLKVNLDFSNAKRQLDTTVADVKDKLLQALPGQGGQSSSDMVNAYQDYFGGVRGTDSMNARIGAAAKQFTDSLAGQDDTQKKYAEQQLAKQIGGYYEGAFKRLSDDSGGVFNNQTIEQAKAKMLQFNNKTGQYDIKDGIDQSSLRAATGLAGLANSQTQLARQIGQNVGLTQQQINGIKDLSDVLPLISNQNIDAASAQNQYNATIKKARDSGVDLTQAQKDQIATMYAQADGLNAATLEANGYSKQVQQTADEQRKDIAAAQAFAASLKNLADAYNSTGTAASDFWSQTASGTSGFQGLGQTASDQAQSLTNSVKSAYSGSMDQIYSAFSSQADEQFQARLDGISSKFDHMKNGVQASMDSLDKHDQAQSQAFSDRWDAIMQQTQDRYTAQQRSMDAYYQKATDHIDGQVKKIQNQQKAEQDLNAAKQKAFQDEQTRLQRLAQLQNNNIDYNRSISTGKLDEAAKTLNTNQALVGGWSIVDQQAKSQSVDDAKTKAENAKIDALNAQKDLLDKQKAAQQQHMQDTEQALERSLNKQKEMQQRAMDAEQSAAKDALQKRMDLINQQEQAAQKSAQKQQQIDKDMLNIELTNLKTFIPMNEQQLQEHIGRVEGAYGKFGIQLQTSGSEWGKIVGGALQQNVANARQQMSQTQAWSAFGSSVSNAITQGAFGMSLNDFFNMILTGQAPKGSKLDPTASHKNVITGGGRAYHTGGLVGTDPGNRLGITGPLQSTEMQAILKKGEFVLNEEAVKAHGTNYLYDMNLGKVKSPGSVTSFPAIFAGFLANGMRDLLASTIMALGMRAQNQASGGTVAGATTGQYTGPVGKGVQQWASVVDQALTMLGLPLTWESTVLRRMNQESGGDPNNVNRWDSNWLRGTPSVGLMQVIGPTFRGAAGPFLNTGPFMYGTSVNPLANVYAGLHYAMGRYGSLSALNQPGGYDKGGPIKPGWNSIWNGTHKIENVLNSDQENMLYTSMAKLITQGTVSFAAVNKAIEKTLDTGSIAKAVSSSGAASGDTYNFGPITIGNDASLTKADVMKAVKDGIMEHKMTELRKSGKIK